MQFSFQKIQKNFFYKWMKIAYISIRGFIEDRCVLRASALTFYTLMSIVPVLAMSLAIAKGFGYQTHLEQELFERFKEQKQVLTQVIIFANNLLENAKSGVIAFIGIIVLFWSVVKVLSHIENAMNHIWRVERQRSWRRKFSDYLAMMLLGPIGFLSASSVTVFIISKLKAYLEALALHATINSPLLFLFRISPYALIWLLFFFLYIFMPNTKVKVLSAFIGGLIAGSAYQFLQWSYLYFQFALSKYSAIYGSFAALPLFLVWIQLSWFIFLFGVEVSCSIQNFDIYEFGKKDIPISHYLKTLLSLWVVYLCVKKFSEDKVLFTTKSLQKQIHIPLNLLDQILKNLVFCGILNEVKTRNLDKPRFQPAKPINDLHVKDVLHILQHQGLDEISLESEDFKKMKEILDNFANIIEESSHNKLLKDL